MPEPARYRKRPVVIEAMRLAPDPGPTDDTARLDAQTHNGVIAEWVISHDEHVEEVEYGVNFIDIDTLEGTMTAGPGDWIIKGVAGEFYPCRDDIFRETYEPEED